MKQVLDCKTVRDTLLKKYTEDIKSCKKQPSVVIVQVGDKADSTRYVNNKVKRCVECGIDAKVVKVKDTISTKELINVVKQSQKDVSAIIVQCPLPNHINEKEVMEVINPLKDCDGLTTENIGLLHDQQPRIIPATALGIMHLLDFYNVELDGKEVLLIGRSNLVNRPLYELLLQRNATPTIAHTHTPNLPMKLMYGYDIVVGAIGQDRYLKEVEATYIIDVGINVDKEGKLHGDFDIDSCFCDYYTPVPSGVGLLTQEAIVSNILTCHMLQFGK